MNPNDQTSKYYDLVYKDIKGDDVIDAEVDLIKSLVSDNARILDVGCGTGRHALPLVREGYVVTGIDTSKGMLVVLKSKIKSPKSKAQVPKPTVPVGRQEAQRSQLKIIKADFFQNDLSTNQFDLAILMWNAFFEIVLSDYQIEKFFEIMQKILKNNGKILINIDNASQINTREINSELISFHKDLKFEQKYKAKDFDEKTNTIILVEDIKVFKDEKLIDEVKSEIKQRWWKLHEIKKAAEKFGFSVEISKLEVNEELYLIMIPSPGMERGYFT